MEFELILRFVDVRVDCCVVGRLRDEDEDKASPRVVFAANSLIEAEEVIPALPAEPIDPASAS